MNSPDTLVPEAERREEVPEVTAPDKDSPCADKVEYAIHYLLDYLLWDELNGNQNHVYPEAVRIKAVEEFGHTFWTRRILTEAKAALEGAGVVARTRNSHASGEFLALTPEAKTRFLDTAILGGGLEEMTRRVAAGRERELATGVEEVLESAGKPVAWKALREQLGETHGSVPAARLVEVIYQLVEAEAVEIQNSDERASKQKITLAGS